MGSHEQAHSPSLYCYQSIASFLHSPTTKSVVRGEANVSSSFIRGGKTHTTSVDPWGHQRVLWGCTFVPLAPRRVGGTWFILSYLPCLSWVCFPWLLPSYDLFLLFTPTESVTHTPRVRELKSGPATGPQTAWPSRPGPFFAGPIKRGEEEESESDRERERERERA